MSLPDLVELAKNAGLNARGYGNYKTHTTGSTFTPVAIMNHHTAIVGDAVVRVCYNGRSGLPGPLCNIVLRKSGEVVVVSNGKANDSGMGDGDVLKAVKNDLVVPKPNGDTINGNPWFYDIEWENLGDGNDPWPAVQIEAGVILNAAFCEYFGWTANRCIDHKEWTTRKIDRRGIDPAKFRSMVDVVLHKPNSTTSLEDDMPTVTGRKFQMNKDRPGQGYALDSHGGIHTLGAAKKVPGTDAERKMWTDKGWTLPPYWSPANGIAPAIDFEITDWDGPSGYVFDVLGGIHQFGDPTKAPAVPGDQRPYWKNGFIPPTVQM